jgi:hypothetical protein
MRLVGFPLDDVPGLSYVGSPSGTIVGTSRLPFDYIVAIPGGAIGPAGPRGLQGDTGPTGAASTVPGPKGDPGEIGPAGPQGVPGIQGVPGEQGPEGPAGIQGPKGDAGASLDIEGTVSTYAQLPAAPKAGSAYVVAADGKLYFYDGVSWPDDGAGVPFVGPQGPQGNAGPAGSAGPTGPQGIQGIQGVQGPAGTPGATGPQGPAAVAGVVGSVAGSPQQLTLWTGTAAQYAALGAGVSDHTVYVVTA